MYLQMAAIGKVEADAVLLMFKSLDSGMHRCGSGDPEYMQWSSPRLADPFTCGPFEPAPCRQGTTPALGVVHLLGTKFVGAAYHEEKRLALKGAFMAKVSEAVKLATIVTARDIQVIMVAYGAML